MIVNKRNKDILQNIDDKDRASLVTVWLISHLVPAHRT